MVLLICSLQREECYHLILFQVGFKISACSEAKRTGEFFGADATIAIQRHQTLSRFDGIAKAVRRAAYVPQISLMVNDANRKANFLVIEPYHRWNHH